MAKYITTGFITDKVNGIKINTSMKTNSDNFETYSKRYVKYIVIHYTGNKKDTAYANANYFKGINRNASAHFFVDNDNIYQTVALKNKAWHCGGSVYYHKECRNTNAWGIEMCCTAGNYKVSAKTITNTAYLTANLCKRLGISAQGVDKYVLRHYDVTHKSCPAQMSNGGANDSDWIAFKNQVKKILDKNATASKPASTAPVVKKVDYVVKVTTNNLNIRKGPGTSYKILDKITNKGAYTIVGESKVGNNTWGLLKKGPVPGSSWICLTGYTMKVK
jgi:N-acetylmuramoyl-L-alanine amidase CwlA